MHLHHERWDGRGYPLGLKGNDVPLIARIIAVADTYDAMTSDRAYRRALPHEVAVDRDRALLGHAVRSRGRAHVHEGLDELREDLRSKGSRFRSDDEACGAGLGDERVLGDACPLRSRRAREVLHAACVRRDARGVRAVGVGGHLQGDASRACRSSASAAKRAFRLGLRAHQEIGVARLRRRSSTSQRRRRAGVGAIGGGALSYKLGAAPWLAFVANAGAIDQSFGGDVALIVAPYTDSGGRQIYTGLRGSVAIPLVPDVRAATTAVTAPIGLSLRPTSASRVFLEAGVMAGGQQTDGFDAQRVGGVGGYASIAVEILSR